MKTRFEKNTVYVTTDDFNATFDCRVTLKTNGGSCPVVEAEMLREVENKIDRAFNLGAPTIVFNKIKYRNSDEPVFVFSLRTIGTPRYNAVIELAETKLVKDDESAEATFKEREAFYDELESKFIEIF